MILLDFMSLIPFSFLMKGKIHMKSLLFRPYIMAPTSIQCIRVVCWFMEPGAECPYQNIFFVFPSLNKQFFIWRLLHVDICMTLRHEHLNYPRKVESGICYKFVDWMAVVCLLVGRPHMLLLGEYSHFTYELQLLWRHTHLVCYKN